MKHQYRRVTLLLAFMLALQPVAAGFTGCMYDTDKSGHAGYGTQTMDGEHAIHQHAMNAADVIGQQGDCLADCDCAGMCLHACHAPSLLGAINMVMLDANEYRYLLIQGFSFPGYTFQLLRPPAAIV